MSLNEFVEKIRDVVRLQALSAEDAQLKQRQEREALQVLT